jgi:putative flippase GtrA
VEPSRSPQTPARDQGAVAATAAWIRSPENGMIGQATRYVISGAIVGFVSIASTITLAEAVGLRFEVAFAIGFLTSIVVQFTLQRLFVWAHSDGFALAMHHQLTRYLPIALGNYGLIAASIAVLPHLLGIATVLVYLASAAVLTIVSFVLFRTRVFHPQATKPGSCVRGWWCDGCRVWWC